MIGALVPVLHAVSVLALASGRMQGIEAALQWCCANPQCVFKYTQEAENSSLPSDLSLPLVAEEHHL